MDPVGNIPLFLTALRHTVVKRRRRIVIRELLIALVVMLIFLFGGQTFMKVFNISPPALTTAGGVILMLIALRMIFPTPTYSLSERVPEDEPFIVPLAVPYVAGPSLLAMEIVLVSRNPHALGWYLLALVVSWLVTAIVLFFSQSLIKLLGEKTLVAIERLMGMVLVIVAVQMTLNGISEYFSLGAH